RMVGVEGFEPPTSCSQSRRATRLRYTPVPYGWFGFPGLCHARGRPAIVRSGRCAVNAKPRFPLAATPGIGETRPFRRRAGRRLPRAARIPGTVSIINPAKTSRAAGVGMPAVDTRASVESLGNLERRMTFRLPAERLEDQVGGRLREIARTARIKGFRPGKVPAKVIEQRFGKQVRDEVLDGMLREGFDEAVRENELRLAG